MTIRERQRAYNALRERLAQHFRDHDPDVPASTRDWLARFILDVNRGNIDRESMLIAPGELTHQSPQSIIRQYGLQPFLTQWEDNQHVMDRPNYAPPEPQATTEYAVLDIGGIERRVVHQTEPREVFDGLMRAKRHDDGVLYGGRE